MPDLTGPLDPHALSESRRILAVLPDLAHNEQILAIPLHWSVEDYGCVDGAYNLVIALKENAWTAEIATSPRLNASHPLPDGYAAHTFMRNSYACGIAVDGMVGATSSDFGDEPIQLHEIEVLCATAAAVAQKYGIDTTERYNGLPAVFTHAEAAIADDYFGERWDLARLHASDLPLTEIEARATGDLLRRRAHDYKIALRAELADPVSVPYQGARPIADVAPAAEEAPPET